MSWCEGFAREKCNAIVIVIDQDRENADKMEVEIRKNLISIKAKAIVCIPIEEIEAWILSDINVLRKVFEINREIKEIKNPEGQPSPKEEISKILKRATGNTKMYVKTSHNLKMFEKIDLKKIENCKQYKKFKKEVLELGAWR